MNIVVLIKQVPAADIQIDRQNHNLVRGSADYAEPCRQKCY